MTDQWRSPTNEELFRDAKPFATLEEFVMAESSREGVVPMAEERQAWRTRREPSPSNEELERRAKPFYSLEQYVTWEDPFESDEEHEAFLVDLYESRRESR